MPTRKIPTTSNPWRCVINNTVYSYTAGTQQTVPDSVAVLIDIVNGLTPKEAPRPGTVGQIWTRIENGEDWQDAYTLPQATKTAIGGVKMGDFVEDATGNGVTKANFNALLSSLRAAGIIAPACNVQFSVAGSTGGTVSGTADGESYTSGTNIPVGSAIVLTATPSEGYSFVRWKTASGDTTVSENAEYNFTANDNISLNAVFQEDTD